MSNNDIPSGGSPPVNNQAGNAIVPVRRTRYLMPTIVKVFVPELHPIKRPVVDPLLPELSLTEQIFEVLRYNAACFEYATGDNGWLRAWLLTSLRVLLLFICPLMVLLVLLSVLVPIFGSIASIFAAIEASARSLFWATLFLLGVAVVLPLTAGWCLLVARWGKRLKDQHDRTTTAQRSASVHTLMLQQDSREDQL